MDVYGSDPGGVALFVHALRRGLQARPPHSAPYLKLISDRILGPVPKVPVDPTRMPLFVVLTHALGSYDPLAAQGTPAPPPPIVVEAMEHERRALPAPRPSAPAPARPPASGINSGPDSDLQLV